MTADLGDAYLSHLRLAVLKAVTHDGRGRANESLIRDVVNGVGLRLGRDQVKTIMAWLADQGLVEVAPGRHGGLTATATHFGHDVAHGDATCPGVKAPDPVTALRQAGRSGAT